MPLPVVAQRHHQQLGALEDAFDFQRQKLLGPLAQRRRGERALFVDERVNAPPQRVIGDPDENPRLHQADAGRRVGGLQQARQHVLAHHAAG